MDSNFQPKSRGWQGRVGGGGAIKKERHPFWYLFSRFTLFPKNFVPNIFLKKFL